MPDLKRGILLTVRIPPRLDHSLNEIVEFEHTKKPEFVRRVLRDIVRKYRKDRVFIRWWEKKYGDKIVLV